jgi:hypothetical protein
MELIKITVKSEWVDPATGEIIVDERVLTDKEVKKPRASKKSSTTDDNPNPVLTLDANKYTLSAGAVELLGVAPGDQLDIKVQKINGSSILVLGTSEAFGTKAGNKVTQKFGVSCRGKAHDLIASYGTVFAIEPHPETEGLFVLKGDKAPEEVIVEEDLPVVTPEAEDFDELLTEDTDDSAPLSDLDFTL